jgi:hypothetical protein
MFRNQGVESKMLIPRSSGHNSVTVQNRTHVYMNFSDHKDLGNHLLQLCPKVVKHLYIDNIFVTTLHNWRQTPSAA